jgi:hypothetical protein
MMYRKPVNKRRSARSFRKNAKRTKAANMTKAPQRGGWRL